MNVKDNITLIKLHERKILVNLHILKGLTTNKYKRQEKMNTLFTDNDVHTLLMC